uniref:COBW domain-containing protein 1 isoform X2 n=1 Tax=Rhizophora mucronata TaxID=61149 RepID=A0A2P2MU77_RHIMU
MSMIMGMVTIMVFMLVVVMMMVMVIMMMVMVLMIMAVTAKIFLSSICINSTLNPMKNSECVSPKINNCHLT